MQVNFNILPSAPITSYKQKYARCLTETVTAVTTSCSIIVPQETTTTKSPTTRASRRLIYLPPPFRFKIQRNNQPPSLDTNVYCTVIDVPQQSQQSDTNDYTEVPIETEPYQTDSEHSDSDSVKTKNTNNSKISVQKNIVTKKQQRRKCAYHKCTNLSYAKLMKIPSIQSTMPKQHFTHNFERILRASKYALRLECLKSIGVPNCSSPMMLESDVRICYKHGMETVFKLVEYIDLNQTKQSTTMVQMHLPVAYDDTKHNAPANNNINNNETPGSNNNSASRKIRNYWRSKGNSAKNISVQLANELGIDDDEWTDMKMSTLTRKSNTFDIDIENNINENNNIKKIKVLLYHHNDRFNDRKPRI
jgi:hypothetical protein